MPAQISHFFKKNIWTDPFQKPTPFNPSKEQSQNVAKRWSTQYNGNLTPTSFFGVNLVAANFSDSWNWETKSLNNLINFTNDYFGVLATEEKSNNTLVFFGGDWGLSSLLKLYVDSELPFLDEDIMDKLKVYQFFDGNLKEPNILMLFLPVNDVEATKIGTKISSFKNYFDLYYHLGLVNVPLNILQDFKYYYPVDVIVYKNVAAVYSEILTRENLVSSFYKAEVSRKYRGVIDLVKSESHLASLGAFCTFLLAEATSYKFNISWENETLTVGPVGYIQALDLFDNFEKILTENMGINLRFERLTNYSHAVSVADNTNFKCFLDNGEYWTAVTDDEQNIPTNFTRLDTNLLEMVGPTKKAFSFKEEAAKYFTSLGYMYVEPNFNYKLNIALRWRTVKFRGQVLTEYFIINRSEETIIHQSNGNLSKELLTLLTKAFNKGLFFSQKIKNLMSGYPDWIPTIYPISLDLSPKPEEAIKKLATLL